MLQTSSLENQENKVFPLEKMPSEMNLLDIFAERKGSYLNEFTLFVAHFHVIPNFIHEIDIDCKKANTWFSETYQDKIRDFHCLKQTLDYYNLAIPEYQVHCTYQIYRDNLASLCTEYHIPLNHHDALSDAKACAALYKMHLLKL